MFQQPPIVRVLVPLQREGRRIGRQRGARRGNGAELGLAPRADSYGPDCGIGSRGRPPEEATLILGENVTKEYPVLRERIIGRIRWNDIAA